VFDDLDDPNDPTIPPLTTVMRRGRTWRARRTSAVVGTSALVLAVGAGALVFALHDNGSHTVRVASPVPDESTSTAVPTTATTPPTAQPTVVETSTTITRVTTPDSPPATIPRTTTTLPAATTPTPTLPTTGVAPDTTPDTAHGEYDWTALTATLDAQQTLSLKSGGSTTLQYSLTNTGTWPVVIPNDPNPDCVVGLFPGPPNGPGDAMWPGPGSMNWEWCNPAGSLTLAPGASVHYMDNVKGYATPPGGTPMPLRPGPSEWTPRPWQYPCGPNPCDQYRGSYHTIAITILPGDTTPFGTVLLETHATVPVGGKVAIAGGYGNRLATAVSVLIPGPCWKAVAPVTATCEWGGAVMTVPANFAAKLSGTLYATSDMTSSGKPLPPGIYKLSIDGNNFALTVTKG
jgi:hypothetical protein